MNKTLFPEYDDIVEGELPQFEVSDIKFEQSIEAPLTPTDTATLSGSSSYTSGLNVYPCIQPPGHVATKNGTGGGGVGLCVRRIGDNGAWQELEVGFVMIKLDLSSLIYRQVLVTVWCAEPKQIDALVPAPLSLWQALPSLHPGV